MEALDPVDPCLVEVDHSYRPWVASVLPLGAWVHPSVVVVAVVACSSDCPSASCWLVDEVACSVVAYWAGIRPSLAVEVEGTCRWDQVHPWVEEEVDPGACTVVVDPVVVEVHSSAAAAAADAEEAVDALAGSASQRRTTGREKEFTGLILVSGSRVSWDSYGRFPVVLWS